MQTEIRVGQLAIPRKHPDYLAWDLAVKILGGEGANRLHRVLRSERGLTYGAEANSQAMKQAGDFVAETEHADRDDRRSAAADRGGVREAAAERSSSASWRTRRRISPAASR